MDESAIFAAALEKDGAARDSFLDEVCAGDAGLRTRIENLIRAHEAPESFLENPAERVLDDQQFETVVGEGDLEGAMIGPYRLLQQIGEGGMGIVFMAEQTEPVKRRVALKIIKPGMDSREVIARFEAERQALAMMDHPGIARVFDAGMTPAGRPFFVMELVNGLPITDYCDEHRLSTRERLELFTSVCHAIQHAHQKGILHRDLKPGNILVAEYDHTAVPKVIDFGVAKATTQQLTEKTLFTQFGQIIGTLEYMSPEQARRNQLDVDTRSDIYSLGVVLYELLTGETPFDKRLRSGAFDEMLKIIREEEPVRPSLKLSGSQSLPAVAAKRGAEPARLPAVVRGDLDWIVLKTLAKERSGRYDTASELAADVTRHLERQPIAAGPPRVLSRVIKFVSRNRTVVSTSLVLIVALLAAGAWHLSERRHQEARQTARSATASEALEQAALALGQAINSPIGRSAEWETARVAHDRLRDALAGGPVDEDVRTRADAFTAEFHSAQVSRQIAEQIEDVVINGATHPELASWEEMERAMKALFLKHGFDLDKDKPADVARRIREHQSAAEWTDLLELWIATRGQMSALGGPRLNAAMMQPWAEAMYAADPDPVRTGIRRLIYSGRRPTPEQVDAVAEDVHLANLSPRGLSWLATVYASAGAADESDRVFRLALRHYPNDVMLNFDYGFSLVHQQRWQEAIRMYMRCLVLRPETAGIWQSMGLAMEQVGELENARDALRRACELESDYGPSWVNLGQLLLRMERFEEALAAGRTAADLQPSSPAPHGIIGRALMATDSLDEAIDALERCEKRAKDDPRFQGPVAEWIAECRRRIAEASPSPGQEGD